MTHVGSRIVVLAAGGLIGATLVATPALATTVDSPVGGATSTTSATYAESTLLFAGALGAAGAATSPRRRRGHRSRS